MLLENTLIIKGNYSNVYNVKSEVELLLNNTKTSKFYNKNLKNLKLITNNTTLIITFQYKKSDIEKFIKLFTSFDVEVYHMCYNEKNNVWIVNNRNAMKDLRLLPKFVIKDILIEYMDYINSSIMLDSFETLKLDRNHNEIVIDNKKQTYDELLNIMFEKTIKGKIVYNVLEQFINNYYDKCINSYEQLYSSNDEKVQSEEPSPLALFIVTFGIFAIIGLFMFFMGYF